MAQWRKAAPIGTEDHRYRELFEHSPDALFVVEVLPGGAFRFESLNPLAAHALDPQGDGLAGRRFDEIASQTPDRERSRLLLDLSAHLARAVESKMPKRFEGALGAAKDADSRTYDFNLVPIADGGGTSHVLCFARDITAHKRYEPEPLDRAKLEERLSNFTACAPGYFYSYRHSADGGNTMPFASTGINELFGLRPEDVEQSIAPLNMRIHGDDMPRVIEAIARSAADFSKLTMEFRAEHPDKGEIWIESSSVPMAEEDDSIVWHGFMHDITKRKRMEAELQGHLRFLESMDSVNKAIQGATDLEQLMGDVLDTVLSVFECDRAFFVYPCDPGAAAWRVPMERTRPEYPGALAAGLEIPMDEEAAGIMRLSLDADHPIKFGPGAEHPMPSNLSEQFGIQSQMLIALHPKLGEPWQFGLHQCSHARTWSRDEEQLLQEIGRRLSDALTSLLMDRNLRKREQEFRSLAENIPDPIFRYDRDCRRIYANPGSSLISGHTVSSLTGSTPGDGQLLVPDQAAKLTAGIRRVFDCGEAGAVDLVGVDRDDRQRDYHMLLVPERDEKGAVATVLGIARDVTVIREAERHMTDFLNNFPGFAYSFRLSREGQGSYPFASPGIERLYGLKPEDVKDDIAPMNALEHPDDLPRIMAAIAESARTLSPFKLEYRIRRPGFPERWVKSRSSPVRQADGSIVWHGIMVDIDERKRVQQRMALLDQAINQASDAIFLVDEELRFHYVNDAACRSLGYSREELLTLGPSDINPDVARETVMGMMRNEAAGKPRAIEARHRAKDGHIFQVEISGVMVEYEGARFALSAVRDITERKQAEQQLRQALEFSESVINAIPDLLFEVDSDGRYFNVWAQNPELLAMQKEAFLGKTIPEVMPPDTVAISMGAIREADEKGFSFGKTIRLELPDGEHWFEFSISKRKGDALSGERFLVLSRDVTVRKQAEIELHSREQEFRELVENSPDLIIRYAPDGRRLYVNPAVILISGKSREALLLNTHLDSRQFVADESDQLLECIRRVVESGQPIEIDAQFSGADGEMRYFHHRYAPEFGPYGDVTSVLSVGNDITERKRMEEILASREREFRTLAENSPDSIVRYDREARFTYVNPKFEERMGIRSGDLLGKTPEQIPGMRNAKLFQNKVREVIELGVADEFEHPAPQPDGRTVWNHVIFFPELDAEGRVNHVQVLSRNITSLKQVEEDLRRSRENLAEAQRIGQMGSWELNLANKALTWSEEVCRIFEIDLAEFGASLDLFLNKVHPDDRETIKDAYLASVDIRMPYSIDHRLLFPDDRIKHVRLSWEMKFAADNKPQHVHGTVQDITSLKVAEQQLKDTQDKLRELVISREMLREDERRHIAWEMHEELGQLLAAMKMRMSGMRSQLPEGLPALSEASQDIISMIDKSIRSIRGMVAELRPAVLLHGIVAALEWLVTEFNKHPGIECELVVDEDDIAFLSDELTTLAFRIAQEALENVVQHLGIGHVIVSWTSKQDGYCLTVRHDGEEIAAADLFGDQSLSVFGMQERVEAFGGEMQVFSMQEYGTVIEARFPNR